MKNCITCNTLKPLADFRPNNKTKDGYLNSCSACSRAGLIKKTGFRQAINAKCKECIYDPIAGGGTWRQQVEDCTSPNCPLFDYRPRPTIA